MIHCSLPDVGQVLSRAEEQYGDDVVGYVEAEETYEPENAEDERWREQKLGVMEEWESFEFM